MLFRGHECCRATQLPMTLAKAAVVFVRREHGWLSEIVSADDAILDLAEIDISMPRYEVYANSGLAEP